MGYIGNRGREPVRERLNLRNLFEPGDLLVSGMGRLIDRLCPFYERKEGYGPPEHGARRLYAVRASFGNSKEKEGG